MHLHSLALSALCIVSCAACGGAGSNREGAPSDATTGIDAPATGGLASEVFAAYGTIETVAGLGAIEDKGVNGWQPGFEGGSALDAELSRPHMAMADGAGNLYVADKDAHAIRKISPEGVITTVAGTNLAGDDGDGPGPAAQMRLSEPNGLWVHGEGVYFVLDLGNDKIRRVDADGVMTTLFAVAGGLSTGRGLWVADDESRAYVAAGSQLLRWQRDAGVSTLASGFASLGNLAVLDSGAVLVTDRLGHRVYEVDPDTGEKTVIAGNGSTVGGGAGYLALETGLNEVRGIWPYPEGGYFLATHKGGQIWFVDDEGVLHLFVDGDTGDTHAGDGGAFDAPGKKIAEPRAVTMDRAGNLVITENDAGFVRIVRRKPSS